MATNRHRLLIEPSYNIKNVML